MFELILGNLVVQLLIGSAVAVLMAALLITLKNHLQAANAKRAERRAERAQALDLALEEASARTAVENPVTEVAGKSAPQAPLPAAKPGPAPTPDAPASAVAASTGQSDAPATTDAPNSAMQDILSSVFGDEEVTGRPEALVADLQDIQSTDLLTLATRLATQLHTKTVTTNGKEI